MGRGAQKSTMPAAQVSVGDLRWGGKCRAVRLSLWCLWLGSLKQEANGRLCEDCDPGRNLIGALHLV